MEKIQLGIQMSRTMTDPTIAIIATVALTALSPVIFVSMMWFLGVTIAVVVGSLSFAGVWAWYNFVHVQDGSAPIDKYVEFKDAGAKQTWSGRRIPISTLCSLYLADKINFKEDVYVTLNEHRDEFVNYKLTFDLLRFLILQLFPNSENSTMKNLAATKKEIAEHYDRGNDWFASFLGPRMVYTSGVFEGLDQTLETAQDNKMSLICDKLQLKSGQSFLDIGCGWGTLCRHAAKHYGAKAVGVTLSVEGAKYCRQEANNEGLADKVDILCMDYRQIPEDIKFDRIASIEMAEHVGLKNFQLYLKNVRNMLEDDGSFLMQVAGLRLGANWEDVAWGLFMSRYIFPGADASTPLNWYVHQLELAGFEVRSVETIGRHYSHTLHRWYDNFQRNRTDMEQKYGGYLCRLWDFFLAWSVIAAGQGSATCYQILVHKNTNTFPRDIYCTEDVAKTSVGKIPRA